MVERMTDDEMFLRAARVGTAQAEVMSVPNMVSPDMHAESLVGLLTAIQAGMSIQPNAPQTPNIHVHINQPAAERSMGVLPPVRRHRVWPWLLTAGMIAGGSVAASQYHDQITDWINDRRGTESASPSPGGGDATGTTTETLPPSDRPDCIDVPDNIDGVQYKQSYFFCYKATGEIRKLPGYKGPDLDTEKVYVQFLDRETGDLYSPLKVESALTAPDTSDQLEQLAYAVHKATEDGGITSEIISLYLVDETGAVSPLKLKGWQVSVRTGA